MLAEGVNNLSMHIKVRIRNKTGSHGDEFNFLFDQGEMDEMGMQRSNFPYFNNANLVKKKGMEIGNTKTGGGYI